MVGNLMSLTPVIGLRIVTANVPKGLTVNTPGSGQ